MTPRQSECLNFIKTYIEMNGYSPTVAEISKAMGLVSRAGSSQYVERLVAKGYLKRSTFGARNIRLCDPTNKDEAMTDLEKAATELVSSKMAHRGRAVVVTEETFERLSRVLSLPAFN